MSAVKVPEGVWEIDTLPCPRCSHFSVIGIMLVTEDNSHQHTTYLCRHWDSGSRGKRCGWEGYTVPGWNEGEVMQELRRLESDLQTILKEDNAQRRASGALEIYSKCKALRDRVKAMPAGEEREKAKQLLMGLATAAVSQGLGVELPHLRVVE